MADPQSQTGEFRRGWQVLLASAAGIGFGISPIPFNMLGHLVLPLNEEFGWSRGQVMVSITVVGLTVTLLAPFFGALVDRFGARRIGLASLIGFGLSWAAVTLTSDDLFVFYALWVAMAIFGGASTPISWTRAVNAWFDTNKGLALAIALMGSGVAGILINNFAPAIMASYGWRGAILASAALPLFIAAPLAFLFVRNHVPGKIDSIAGTQEDPATVEEVGIQLKSAARMPVFWIMFAAFACVALAFAGLHANLVPLLYDDGFTMQQAGAIAGLVGVAVIVGRLGAGFLLDRFWAPLVALPLLIAPAIACIILIHTQIDFAFAAITAILIGLAAGVESDLIAFLSARYFGLLHYGKIYGVMYMAFSIGSSISPALYGYSYDVFGSYDIILYAAAIMFALGGILLLFIGKYPSKADLIQDR